MFGDLTSKDNQTFAILNRTACLFNDIFKWPHQARMKSYHWGQLTASCYSRGSKLCYHKIKSENLHLKLGKWQWGFQLSIPGPFIGKLCAFVSFVILPFEDRVVQTLNLKSLFAISLWPTQWVSLLMVPQRLVCWAPPTCSDSGGLDRFCHSAFLTSSRDDTASSGSQYANLFTNLCFPPF